MFVLGITGGVGAGKSEILNYLAENYQPVVIRLDDVAREMQMPGGSLYQAMIDLGGPEVVTTDGELDRKLFAEKMYKDKTLRQQINSMVHPAVKEESIRRIAEAKESGCKLCVIEAALLIEDHYDEICDELWYIYASEETRRERLKSDRGYTDRLIDRIMKSQQTEDGFRRGTAYTIDNDGSFSETIKQIDDRLNKL